MAKTSERNRTDTDHRGDNAATEPRDGQGRFARKRSFDLPEVNGRNAAIGAAVIAGAVGLGAALFRGWRKDAPLPSEPWGDDATNEATRPLAGGVVDGGEAAVGGGRAPDQFRPDVNAPVGDDKRGAFAPATTPVPSRVAAMGNGDL